jgi:predicted RNA polymerase sigma factor
MHSRHGAVTLRDRVGAGISRAKQGIAAAGASFAPAPSGERAERLPVVLHVLHLTFNEGYAATSDSEAPRPGART